MSTGSEGFATDLYAQARANRLRNLFAHIDVASLRGKRVLELGCGTGELGEEFVRLGCEVVSVDARPEHVETLKRQFPHRRAYVRDLEDFQPGDFGRFDAVFSFGLLYHIARPTRHLRRCAAVADTLFLETMVCDSDEAVYLTVPEDGFDQAFAGSGCRPSKAWIRLVMASCGFDTRDISTGLANWGGDAPSVFNWPIRNDGRWRDGNAFLRGMFVCTRRAASTAAA